jgi:hypothetical protein
MDGDRENEGGVGGEEAPLCTGLSSARPELGCRIIKCEVISVGLSGAAMRGYQFLTFGSGSGIIKPKGNISRSSAFIFSNI